MRLPDPYVADRFQGEVRFDPIRERMGGVQRNFEKIAQLLVDTGGRSIKLRLGTHTFNISANNSGVATVAHGLDTTPVVVLATTDRLNWFASTSGYDDSDFTLEIREHQSTNVTVDVAVGWLALG